MEIDLTPDQVRKLEPLFDSVTNAHKMGLPGILVAQVIRENDQDGRRYLRVGFVKHAAALKIVHSATEHLPLRTDAGRPQK